MGKGFAIAALVLGICSIVFCFFGYMPLIAGILAIVFAVMHYNREGNAKLNHGLATAGLVTGIIGTIFSVIYSLLWTLIFGVASSM